MKCLARLFALGVAVTAFSNLALASPLTGTLTIDGGLNAITPSVLNSSTTSITSGGGEFALGGSGNLASVPILSAINFVSVFNFVINVPTGGEVLYTFIEGALTDVFTVSSVQTAANGSLIFYGTLSDGIAADSQFGSYLLTPNVTADGSFSGTLDMVPTPEPSTLLLLGTGLAGAAGILFRKRQKLS
jgi:hypothetical protein